MVLMHLQCEKDVLLQDPVEERLAIQDNFYKPWEKKVTGRDFKLQ